MGPQIKELMIESECDETLSDVGSWAWRISNAMIKISAEILKQKIMTPLLKKNF